MDEAASLLQETGFSRPVCSLNVGDKASLSALIINYHYMIKPKAAVDQFIKGLDTLRVSTLARDYPDLVKPYFTDMSDPLTAG